MKKFKHVVALLLTIATLLSLVACSSSPKYTEAEATASGYALLNPAEGNDREFNIHIIQGSSYEYILEGVVKDKKSYTSLTVLHKGLKSYYPNLFVVDGDNLFVNLNSAMTATEDQVDFLFTESKELQGRFLEIPNGRVLINELIQAFQQAGMNELVTAREQQEPNGKGYAFDRIYTNEATKNTLSAMQTKVETNKQALIDKINNVADTWSGDDKETLNTILQYLNGCYDMDDKLVKEEYPSLGEHILGNVIQEITKLATFAQESDVQLEEGITWDSKTNAFTHDFILWKGDDIVGCIYVSTSNGTDADTSKVDITKKIGASSFLPILLQNAKNAMGIGYETNDFPFEATYTSNTLTLRESNDVYSAEHIFTMSGGTVIDYVIHIDTYEYYMHDALKRKYEELGYTCTTNNSASLEAGTGSGVLAFHTYTISASYNCDNPVLLLSIMQQIGVPGYEIEQPE